MEKPEAFRLARGFALVCAALLMSAATASGQDGASAVEIAIRKGEFDRAAKLLEAQARAGDAEAQYQLASLFRAGRGVALDEKQAFKWFHAAAEKGHAKAQYVVAMMLLSGRGVAHDPDQGRKWLEKAASQGHEQAVRALAEPAAVQAYRGAAPRDTWAATVAKPSAQDGMRLRSGPAPGGRPVLVDAAWRGQNDVVVALLQDGANVEEADSDGNTALAMAASAGHVAIIGRLLASRASVDARNKDGRTPLMLAAMKGRADAVAKLVAAGAAVDARDPRDQTALDQAITACDAISVSRLLAAGAHLTAHKETGETGLMTASAACKEDVVEAVLKRAADGINNRDRKGRTALWHAADRGTERNLSILLAKGADPAIADLDGDLPLLRAIERSRPEAAGPLLKAASGAMAEHRNGAGNTPLILAASMGLTGIARELVERKASLDARNRYGDTALMSAARQGHAEIVKLLVAAGADRSLRNKKREQARDIARMAGRSELVTLLE